MNLFSQHFISKTVNRVQFLFWNIITQSIGRMRYRGHGCGVRLCFFCSSHCYCLSQIKSTFWLHFLLTLSDDFHSNSTLCISFSTSAHTHTHEHHFTHKTIRTQHFSIGLSVSFDHQRVIDRTTWTTKRTMVRAARWIWKLDCSEQSNGCP